MKRIVRVDTSVPCLGEAEATAWFQWLARHGLDPYQMAIADIVCDDDERRIYYLGYVLNEDGKRVVDGNEAVKRTMYVQLEAPALPIPPGYPVEQEN